MGSFSKIRNDAKSFIGRNWGRAKHYIGNAKAAIDAGVGVYRNLQPLINEGVEAFGNTRVKDFNRKAQGEIEGGIKRGMQFAREFTSHVDKIDDLGNRAFANFA